MTKYFIKLPFDAFSISYTFKSLLGIIFFYFVVKLARHSLLLKTLEIRENETKIKNIITAKYSQASNKKRPLPISMCLTLQPENYVLITFSE